MLSTKRIMILVLVCVFQCAMSAHGQEASNYLITTDIGSFVVSGDSSAGKGPGILAGADHFYQDHNDMTYEIDYFNLQTKVGPEVQVTQHTNSDSDKWLLHEVEDSYRTNDKSRLGLLSQGAIIKRLVVGGGRIFSIRYGGGSYMWVSNNVVVNIDYTDMQGGKPEPREIISAYLQKFPSTIPATLVLDQAHDIQWIKDEMERRLWLCDKWFVQITLGKADEKTVLQAAVKSMNVFLDYREKYYGLKAADEKNLLAGYLNSNNGTGIKAKLVEYKNWWTVNKEKGISL